MTEITMLETCDECHVAYPIGYCNTMRGFSLKLGGSFIKFVCGICALEIGNKLHGIKREKFTGPQAEHLRQKAIEYRKAHK